LEDRQILLKLSILYHIVIGSRTLTLIFHNNGAEPRGFVIGSGSDFVDDHRALPSIFFNDEVGSARSQDHVVSTFYDHHATGSVRVFSSAPLPSAHGYDRDYLSSVAASS